MLMIHICRFMRHLSSHNEFLDTASTKPFPRHTQYHALKTRVVARQAQVSTQNRAMTRIYVSKSSIRRTKRRRRWLLLVLGIAVCAAVYEVGARLAVPHLVERVLLSYEAQSPGRAASVARVVVAPFRLGIEMIDLRFSDSEAGLAVTVPRMRGRFAARSVLAWRVVFDTLDLEAPSIVLTRGWDSSGALLSASLLESVRVAQLRTSGATFEIAEQGGSAERRLLLQDMTLGITELDARAQSAGSYILSAGNRGGVELASAGVLAAGFAGAQGRLTVSRLALEDLRPWLQAPLVALAPQGLLTVSGDYTVNAVAGRPAFELSAARAELVDFVFLPHADVQLRSALIEFQVHATFAYEGGRGWSRTELDLEGERFELIDARLSPPLAVDLIEAAGTVAFGSAAGADGNPGDVGDSRLDASLDLRAQLTGGDAVTLSTQPGRMALSLRAVPATLLSPYSEVTFGQALANGRVDLGFDYTRRGERLEGALRLAVAGLDLQAPAAGQAIDTGAPLPLAAALLEDANGDIRTSVPFAADTSANVAAALAGALRARVAALAAAPFDVLGLVVARPGSSLRVFDFEPGAAALGSAAQSNVAALADTLQIRPRLNVRVHGDFDPSADREALAVQQIELHVLLATAGPTLRARPERVNFASPRAQDVLDEFAGERLGPGRLAAIAARYPVESNAATPAGERGAYYGAVFDALVANEPIEAAALQRLSRFRAQALVDALAAQGVAPERLALAPVDADAQRSARAWLSLQVL
jgi:hypothetical protein